MIVDGHNRHEICTRRNIPFSVVEIQFADAEEAKDWIDANQLGRRNLTPDQSSILRGRRYNRTKKAASDNLKHGSSSPKSQNDTSGDTATALAKQHGVSRATIIRDGKKADALEKLAAEHHVSPATVKRAGEFASAVETVRAEEPETVKKGEAEILRRAKEIKKARAAKRVDERKEKAKEAARKSPPMKSSANQNCKRQSTTARRSRRS